MNAYLENVDLVVRTLESFGDDAALSGPAPRSSPATTAEPAMPESNVIVAPESMTSS